MKTFNKIKNPCVTYLNGYSKNGDGSIQVEYCVAVGSEEKEGEIANLQNLSSSWLYIDAQAAQAINDAPLTQEDIGKPIDQIMLDRLYRHLVDNNQIVV